MKGECIKVQRLSQLSHLANLTSTPVREKSRPNSRQMSRVWFYKGKSPLRQPRRSAGMLAHSPRKELKSSWSAPHSKLWARSATCPKDFVTPEKVICFLAQGRCPPHYLERRLLFLQLYVNQRVFNTIYILCRQLCFIASPLPKFTKISPRFLFSFGDYVYLTVYLTGKTHWAKQITREKCRV